MFLTKLGVTLASVFTLLGIVNGSIPGAPTKLVIDGLGSRRINISWIRPADDGNSTQLNYTVYYKVQGESVLQEVEVGRDIKATLSAKPYRKYEIFVKASNKDGYGPRSLEKIITTLEEEPEKCPKLSSTPDERDGNDLHLFWEEVPNQYRNGIIKGYKILYVGKTTGIKYVYVNDSSTKTYTFYNLSKEENYGFKVAAFTKVGFCKDFSQIQFEYESAVLNTTTAQPTTTQPTTAQPTTAQPTTAQPTTAQPTTQEPTTQPTAQPTTQMVETTTTKPTEPTEGTSTSTSECAGCKTDVPTQGDALASTRSSDWLIYVLIALAVIVAIMGVTIFLLIWQLYKNHRFYKLRQEQYKMKTSPNMGTDNEGHDNPV